MDNQNYLTEEGLNKLKEELDVLKNIKRPDVIKRIEIAREYGDLSENAAYHDAREEQSFLEGRILELEDMIKKGVVVDAGDFKKDTVSIGKKIKMLLDNKEQEIELVGATESDALNGLISYISPLGEAIMNKKIGDEFEFNTPRGAVKCKILEIK